MEIKNKKGMALVLVMVFIAIMLASTVSLSTMVQRDVILIRKVKEKEQARFIAEAGINHALAIIRNEGFASRSDFTDSLDTGSYSVTFSTTGGRHLIGSTGTTTGGAAATASAEIEDNTATALYYFTGAGNDIKINALVANAEITGDIHANNDTYLKAGPIFARITINGDVSASGIVKEGSRHYSSDMLDSNVYVNGFNNDSATIYEDDLLITFPTFNYEAYKQAAIDSGDYYSGNQTFSSQSFTPGNGIVYVDGDASIHGNCTFNGGIIADNIHIHGTFNQVKSGNRNVVIAKNGDVRIFGRLYVEEALVYASRDVQTLAFGADVEVTGLLLARRDIHMWNVLTYIDYLYAYIEPADMLGYEGGKPFRVVSWNS